MSPESLTAIELRRLVRPAVLSAALLPDLIELLSFRHFFRHAYAVAFDERALRRHGERLLRAHPLVKADLDPSRRLRGRHTQRAVSFHGVLHPYSSYFCELVTSGLKVRNRARILAASSSLTLVSATLFDRVVVPRSLRSRHSISSPPARVIS